MTRAAVPMARAHRAHQSMGIIGYDVSLEEWERQLSNRAKHLGIDVEDLQALDMLAAEQHDPGVVERCAPKRVSPISLDQPRKGKAQ
jgi:hypothetical protein